MNYRKIEELIETHNINVNKLAKATGIPASTFSDWKNGRSVPKIDKLKRIADYFGVSLDFLIGSRAGRESEMAGYTSVKARKMVPIIGEIRAGTPIITNETLLGYEFADVDDIDEYFFLQVCGDSMKDIGMVDGSLVLFRKQQYAKNGDIVACLVGGDSATVKRFQRSQRNIYLIPENEDYSPIKLTTDDFESGEARILGVAMEIKIKL